MDLLKKNIHMDRIRCEAVTQITLEDDKNLPDNKPDVSSINLQKAEVVFEEVRPGSDMVDVKGNLKFKLLYYTTEGGSGLVPLEGMIPFDERMVLRGVTPADTVSMTGEVEDFSVELINSRKLNARALLTLTAEVEELYDEQAPIGVHYDSDKGDQLEYRRQPMQIAQIAICKNDIFRVRDEITLPGSYPNIAELLWSDLQLGDVEFRIMSEKIGIQGEVQIFLLYTGEGEDSQINAFETSIPFAGMLDCHGCKEGMLPDIHYTISQQELSVRPDLDGEERCVGLEMTLEIHMHIYEEENTEILSDIYGVTREVAVQTKPVQLARVRACVTGKTKVSDRIRIPGGSAGILQILHSDAQVCQEQQSIVENGIALKGALQVRVLYITGDDRNPYACVDAQIPYQYTLEIPGIQPEDESKVRACVDQLQVTMLDGEEMSVKGVLSFSTMVFEKVPTVLIHEVEVKDADSAVMSNLPGMVIYVVKKGDSLWSIGRKYYVPVERIKELNHLASDEIQPGQKLLILRGQ